LILLYILKKKEPLLIYSKNIFGINQIFSGKMAERFKATDCKSVDIIIVGSNPTLPKIETTKD
jgi:hypothetical protein